MSENSATDLVALHGALCYNTVMKKHNDGKKLMRKEKRNAFRLKATQFLKKNHRAVAAVSIAVFMAGYLSGVASIIAYAVYSGEEVTIGEPARNILTYDKPSTKISKKHNFLNGIYKLDGDYNDFQQASLPIGSGDLGAAIYGETAVERIVFNEKTLWSAGPKEGQTD